MAITFPASAHAASATCPKPAGVANGSVLVGVALGLNANPIAAPSGWTQIAQPSESSARLGVFYKVITDAASEPANYAFTGWFYSGITRCEGVDTANVLDATATLNSAPTATSVVLPSVTTGHDGSGLIVAGFTGNPTIAVPTVSEFWTESGILTLHGDVQALAGSSGTRTVQTNGATAAAIGVMTALRAAGAPDPQPPIHITGTLTIDLTIGIG